MALMVLAHRVFSHTLWFCMALMVLAHRVFSHTLCFCMALMVLAHKSLFAVDQFHQLQKVYKLELEMLEGDNNQPVGILSWAGEVKKMLSEPGFAYL